MLQVLKPLGFFGGCIFFSRPPKSRIPGGIRCSSSFRACEGAESDGTVEPLLAVETYRETMTGAEWLWRFEIWSPSHEGLGCFWRKSDPFFLIPILHWGMPCNARISQMELKELSVTALESRELMPIFSGCTLYMGTFWNLQSSNPRPLTEATTYNSNRKFTHEMAEDTGMERWTGRNMVVHYSFLLLQNKKMIALMVKYQAAWV